jgi:hypothetical protein
VGVCNDNQYYTTSVLGFIVVVLLFSPYFETVLLHHGLVADAEPFDPVQQREEEARRRNAGADVRRSVSLKGPFTRNVIFVSHRVVRHLATKVRIYVAVLHGL